ncbi:hypothetical protein D6T64_06290 [Cryobacterium melibiosiphilum]|uniref:Uncharacterized protein n=1 Tax=Cryobacterium melibiosiphilum TaxID=995039 RepID=A0A3A5MQX4_9MICO|nr:hypothetical protein D6T64_06290 [Cryobacterium melibiosiphilum]
MTWLSTTARVRRAAEMVRPERPTQIMPAKARETTTASTEGAAPPPRVCESAATRVAKTATTQPRAKRAQREVMSPPAFRVIVVRVIVVKP